jgi:hypothetical protein
LVLKNIVVIKPAIEASMNTLDNILDYFRVKSHFIIYKHSIATPFSTYQYSNVGTSSFLGNFGSKIKEVDEELTSETVGILNKFGYEPNVDFDGLMEGLYNCKNEAKMEFIKLNQR